MHIQAIEKILSVRDAAGKQEVLVKYKNTSYLHLDWVPSKLLEADKHQKQKLIKFLRNPPLAAEEVCHSRMCDCFIIAICCYELILLLLLLLSLLCLRNPLLAAE